MLRDRKDHPSFAITDRLLFWHYDLEKLQEQGCWRVRDAPFERVERSTLF